MPMSDMTVAVTGVASGIGAAAARLLKARGATVVGFDLNQPDPADVDAFVHLDQADPKSIDEASAKTPLGLGGLLNVAGIPPAPRYSPAEVLRVNFFGLRLFTEALLPKLERDSAIVNLASGAGFGWRDNVALVKAGLAVDALAAVDRFVADHGIHNDGLVNNAAYPLSKQLLIVWTMQAFGLWRSHGIRMNAVAPAGVTTPILDAFMDNFGDQAAKRMRDIGQSTPEEIATIAITLLDRQLAWVNGAVIPAERGALTAASLAAIGLAPPG